VRAVVRAGGSATPARFFFQVRCYDGFVVSAFFVAPPVRMAALSVSTIVLGLAGCGHRALHSGIDAAAADVGQTDAAEDAPTVQDSPTQLDSQLDTSLLANPDLPVASAADAGHPDACEPVGCSRGGTDYCGVICDGCGGTVQCPAACGPDRTCDFERGICVGSACTPLTCVLSNGTRYCGFLGDGCGGALECGDCPEGRSCNQHVCSEPADCRRLACTPAPPHQTERYCGTIDDCCGGILDCGKCLPGWECLEHVCIIGCAIGCVPFGCQMDGYTYCGRIGDGCGGETDCSAACPEGWTCRNHVCVALPGRCTPVACEAAGRHRFCGRIGDGCGGDLECGDCPAGQVCASTGNCQPSPCDGCAPVDPRPPMAPIPALPPLLRYQCPVPSPVTAPTLPPTCPRD
jgi:hypothetical protein